MHRSHMRMDITMMKSQEQHIQVMRFLHNREGWILSHMSKNHLTGCRCICGSHFSRNFSKSMRASVAVRSQLFILVNFLDICAPGWGKKHQRVNTYPQNSEENLNIATIERWRSSKRTHQNRKGNPFWKNTSRYSGLHLFEMPYFPKKKAKEVVFLTIQEGNQQNRNRTCRQN